MTNQQSFNLDPTKKTGPVECLGQTFESDEARREHFLALLADKLKDPEFRRTPGFPKGTDEDILRLSDPPWYTACPNPWLADFVRCYGKPYDPNVAYEREPFAVDVSVGKTDALYKAHSYHTKVPHLAIVPSILHYTEPGDVVLDGFCGSGMTGLAAQWCGAAPDEYKRALEGQWKGEGKGGPKWGARRAVLNDLGPAASFIAAGFNLPFDVGAFEREATRLMDEVEAELGWMYETIHTDGKSKGRINYTVWSEVFSCPYCSGEVVFTEEALDPETKRVSEEFLCPACGATLSRRSLDRFYVKRVDKLTGLSEKAPKRVPVIINYDVNGNTYEKTPTVADVNIIAKVESLPLPKDVPSGLLPYMHMTHERARMDAVGVTHVHHFFLPRATHAMATLWRKGNAPSDPSVRRMLVWFVEQAIWGLSLLNRYKTIMHGKTASSNVNQYLSGVYYIPSQHSEVSPRYNLSNRLSRLVNQAFSSRHVGVGAAILQIGDCSTVGLRDESIDYVFTDPPFGENIYYADLNFLVESWHRVFTCADNEAIVDQAKKKGVPEYQELIRRCFAEYFRVLKPGRWMTVVFSNSSNAIWHTIQEAMGTSGFVIADVRTLDKQQGSYRQVTSSAVKQDLVISAYKPTQALTQRFQLGKAAPETAWAFVKEHLHNVPVFVGGKGQSEVVVERTPQMLLDRMTAFHVQRGIAVPLSGGEFLAGLNQRFPLRDGMYFLSEQVAEYDRKRTSVTALRQASLFVSDEASAIQWVRRVLQEKPQSFQDLQPQFMRELQAWAKHEQTVELRTILEQNFLHYDGQGPVPNQIHAYLSSNWKELRSLAKDDPVLVEKADDRWYVPDPSKQSERDKLRERALLKEFEEYRTTTQRKLKVFRTEAVRAGFKAAYDKNDYATIVAVVAKLPENVLHEDDKLLMYFDVAQMRLGAE